MLYLFHTGEKKQDTDSGRRDVYNNILTEL
jgi:hypothetical protein